MVLFFVSSAEAKDVKICGQERDSKTAMISCPSLRGDADFDGLEHFTNLKIIDLNRPRAKANLSDSTLKKIASYEHLKDTMQELRLAGKKPTGAGWKAFFASFPELTKVSAIRSSVDDTALEGLAQAKKLEELSVRESAATCSGLRHLVDLPKLKLIDVSKLDCSDKDVEVLLKLKGLEILRARGTDFSNAAHEKLTAAGIKVID